MKKNLKRHLSAAYAATYTVENMKKILDLTVLENRQLTESYHCLRCTCDEKIPLCLAGQFAQLYCNSTTLRRPISINMFDEGSNEVSFLINSVGKGTAELVSLQKGAVLNAVLPLGRGFTMPSSFDTNNNGEPLLVGGGVGTAPLLMLGKQFAECGTTPVFLLGARSASGLLQLEEFAKYGRVFTTTEDGSHGERGFVTQHSILKTTEAFCHIYTCGPTPMMKAVAKFARENGIACEVSLENLMACGIGACLCCVEKTTEGHKCVCTDGPVFNINELTWQL